MQQLAETRDRIGLGVLNEMGYGHYSIKEESFRLLIQNERP